MPSWEVKDKMIYTDKGRKYIGVLNYNKKDYITYYISKEKSNLYIRQTINDIQKTVEYKNIIIFMENTKMLSKGNQYFIFGKSSTLLINPSEKNFEKMRLFQNIDMYEIIEKVYKDKEILLSNWSKADYMTQDKQYIVMMPFLDTEKLHKLNIFYKENKVSKRRITILTLKENKSKINEILTNRTNILEIDSLLGGINGELEKI